MIRRLAFLFCLFLLAGCSKSYVVTTPVSEPLTEESCIQIAEIQDLLPEGTDESKRPSAEDMIKFKVYLAEQVVSRDKLAMSIGAAGCSYEIQGSLLSYKKGSGFVRWIVGFGAGKAEVVTELKLVDTRDGSTVFGGNFTGEVTSALDSGDQMFRVVSANFAKELEKEVVAASKS